MDTTIYPQKNQDIRLDLPCSKSLAHRYIIASCLAQEKSTIGNITLNQDIEATIETMRHLGAKITYNDHCLEIEGITSWQYDGCELDCHESGSTLRFLIPLCTLIAEDVCLTGTLRLLARPQDVYEKLFAENNVKFVKEKDKLIVGHGLKGGHYRLDGNISSQFITGLLFVLPLLKEDSYLEIIEPFASRSYVDLTMQVLQQFNVDVAYVDHNHIKIKGNQRYQAGNHLVEADYSQLAFFAALGILNNGLEVGCFDEASKQGDKAVIDILRKMGADIHFAKGYYHFKPSQLQGCQIDLEDCPDLGPMLFALSTMAQGKTHFINTKRLKIKESDRVMAMVQEMRKLGCKVSYDDNSLSVEYQPDLQQDIILKGHNDHRIVMALSIIATLAKGKITISGSQAINKSYPAFFSDLAKTGIEVKHHDN